MTDIQVAIKNKTYQTTNLHPHKTISNLNLTFSANEFVCLLGPSGCGKTTLLNIIANLDTDYEGEVILGKNQKNTNIGYVFQNPRLLPWRTVRENIELALHSQHSENLDRKSVV